MCEQSSSPEPDPEPKKPRLIHAAMTTIQEQVNTSNITEPDEHIEEQPGVLCCTCSDIVNITFTDSCSRCPDYMCWDCIIYYRCNEYGLVKGKFVCSCCAGLDDEETSQSTSTMSSLEGSDSEDDESQLLQHWKNWQQSNMTSHTLGTCPINTGSQDSHSAYLYGSVQDQPEFKEKEDKSKMKNYKRKRKGRSNKKRRSTRTTGKKTRNQDKSGSLREQLPEGDVSQREHAPELLAEQLPGSPNVPQETGTEPLDLRWLVDSQMRDMAQEETVPQKPKTIVLEIFRVSKNDNRHSCDKPICMYKIHLLMEGLQPGTEQKSDVKLCLTDAITNWTGEVNSYVNEARRMRNTIKYCQQVTIDIDDSMSLRRGDTVTVRLQNHGYTISILTRDGLREPIKWDLEQFIYLKEASEELIEYIEVDFYDVNIFQSQATGDSYEYQYDK